MLRRMMLRSGGTLLFGAAVVIHASGCKQDDVSQIFVRQVQAIIPPTCTTDNSPDSVHIEGGVLDVALRETYVATMLVGNQVITRGSQDLVRTETSKVTIEEAEVHVQDSSGTDVSAYTIPVSGFVDEDTGNVPGYGLTDVTLIDATSAQLVAGDFKTRRLFSKVKVRGHTLGGSPVESGEFGFPVEVCYGCLVEFPPDSRNTDIPGANCLDTMGSVKLTQCRFGQDDPVDCRQCVGSSPACTPSQ